MDAEIETETAAAGASGERTDRYRSTHDNILAAAREVFATSGFARASTIDIARAAGVSERTLFRHFVTKSDLFQEAVVAPFHDYIESYVTRWRAQPPGSLEPHQAVRQFYAELFDLLDRDRGLIIALASAREFEDADGILFPELASNLAEQLGGLEGVMNAEANARGFTLDPGILARIMFGLVLTISVHGEWLFGPNAPARDILLDQLAAFTNHGMRGR